VDWNLADRAQLDWLLGLGLSQQDHEALSSCVPGEFTLPDAYYVNTATPRIIYRGTAEGTLPMVTGRWYLIPEEIVGRHAELTREAVPVARAARLARP
jgi:hypothetical protein